MTIARRKNGYLFKWNGGYIDVYNSEGHVRKEFLSCGDMEPKPWNLGILISRWEARWGSPADAYYRLAQTRFYPPTPPRRRRTATQMAAALPEQGVEMTTDGWYILGNLSEDIEVGGTPTTITFEGPILLETPPTSWWTTWSAGLP